MADDTQPKTIHQREQWQRWREFRDKLEALKAGKLGTERVTQTKIAEGLKVSRQRLYTFIQEPEPGLPIQRYNVLELWDYLGLAGREEYASQLDDLLRAAGFLPLSKMLDQLPPQIKRVQRRLANPIILKSPAFCDITDNIFNLISDKGLYTSTTSQHSQSDKQGLTLKDARAWPKQKLQASLNSQTVHFYQKALTRYTKLGKIRFCDKELFELYQEIDENRELGSQAYDQRAVDCQFQSPSILLCDWLSKTPNPVPFVEQRLKDQYIEAEKALRLSVKDVAEQTEDDRLPYFPPVIESSVKLRFKIEKGKHLYLILRHASSSTHIESALIALSDGMGGFLGPESGLSMANLSVKSLGKSSESLSRIFVTLVENKDEEPKSYQGVWVEQNTILGILQATIFAAMEWLADRLGLQNIRDVKKFFELSDQVQEALSNRIAEVFNFRAAGGVLEKQIASDEHSKGTVDNGKDSLISKIKELAYAADKIYERAKNTTTERVRKQEIQEYYDSCKRQLDYKNFLATVILAYEKIIDDKPKNASDLLSKLEDDLLRGDLLKTSNHLFAPINTLYTSARIIYGIIVGDEDFLQKRKWVRETAVFTNTDAFEELSEYTEKVREGVIDSDVYLAAGCLCSARALASFYTVHMARKQAKESMRDAVDLFVRSAHYSAKLGHLQQAARRLCYASRCSILLGEDKEALVLLELSEKLHAAKHFSYKFSGAHLYIAYGEWYLAKSITSDKDKLACLLNALKYFQKACECNGEVPRIKIDIQYDIYRALKQINLHEGGGYLLESLDKKIADLCSSGNDSRRKLKPGLVFSLKPIVGVTDKTSCQDAATKIQENVIKTWNKWYLKDVRNSDQSSEHPFADAIRKDIFLQLPAQ